jgi:hypothetical protein
VDNGGKALAQHLRKRARQLRNIALDVRGRENYQALLDIAKDIEQMAKDRSDKRKRSGCRAVKESS